MSAEDLAARVILDLVTSSTARRNLFGPRARQLRQIRQGTDIYRLIAHSDGAVRTLVRTRLGDDVFDAIVEMDRRWTVSREQAEAYRELVLTGRLQGRELPMLATHEALIEGKSGTLLGRLLESDHIIEQRIHRLLRDGPDAHILRSPLRALADTDAHRAMERAGGAFNSANGEQMNDALAILVPANGVVSYRLARLLSSGGHTLTPLFYVHRGLGSKTNAMRQLVPWRLEGAYSWRELFDATRWATMYQFGLPRPLQEAVRQDMIDSIMEGLEGGTHMEREIARGLGLRNLSNEAAVERALIEALPITGTLPRQRFRQEWKFIDALVGPATHARWDAQDYADMLEHAHRP